jgi:hypothetical protein
LKTEKRDISPEAWLLDVVSAVELGVAFARFGVDFLVVWLVGGVIVVDIEGVDCTADKELRF